VHELFYINSQGWQHSDLTTVTGAPPVASNSPLDGYETTFNQQQHVNYLGTDGHVHELFYIVDKGWQHSDLTAAASAPPPRQGSPLDGYETMFTQQQHVNYLGTDGHVHELFYIVDKGWQHSDLTAVTGAPSAVDDSPLNGYETAFNQQQHVNYLGTDGHVHELFYVIDKGWQHNDLTAAASAPAPVQGSPLHGYATTFNQQQHVNYLDSAGHVHELFFTNDGGWQHNELSAPPAVAGSPLGGYETTFNQQQHVNYLDSAGHVHELFFTNDGGWQHNELSAPPAVAGSPLGGYETTFNQQQHVNYLDSAGHVHELWYSNGNGMTNVITENVWNGDGVTGGGVSEIFARPSWQDSAGVPASISTGFVGRGVPDVAGNADPATGYPVFVNGQNVGPVGGTSATAPLYAGLIASINTGRGRPIGYLNVNLYALAGPYVFRDIADGRSNASGGAPGYTSHAGWDACTGLGSVDGTALLAALLKVLP
jgi:hypothetical protein